MSSTKALTDDINLGDEVRMQKRHPCGGFEWHVTRLGADIGIKCNTCGRYVLMPRRVFKKQLEIIISQD